MSEKLLEFRWGTSRGVDTAGYTLCSLWVDGRRVARECGGGYDMKGAALGNYIARAYADRLRGLTADDMPAQSHWEPAFPRPMGCADVSCRVDHKLPIAGGDDFTLPILPADAVTCPNCGGEAVPLYHEGRRVDDGRYFYGLRFYDPSYNPAAEVVTEAMVDGVFIKAGDVGKPLGASGDVGLMALRAAYSNSSPIPTARHTVPAIDGACGVSSVETIMKSIGLALRFVSSRSKCDTYLLIDSKGGAL